VHPLLALALGSLLFGAFSTAWLVLQSPNFFSGYDFVRMHAFYREFYRNALLGGRLPLWNPYVGLGRPFLSDIETQTLYPPNLLVLPLGVYVGTAALLVLHQAAAFFGGVRFGRKLGADAVPSLLVGAGMALSSPFTARLASGAVPVYFSLCWWPALLWLGVSLQDGWTRRAGAAFALVTALAILAGNPPILYAEFLGLLTLLACRLNWGAPGWRAAVRNHAGLALASAIGAGLAAAQLLPFAELVGEGNRPLHAPGFAGANGMPPASWLSLIFPTSAAFGPNWEYDLYCGLVPLFAAVAGIRFWRERNVRALLGLGLAGALLSPGDRAPFLGWVAHVVPGASALRIPSRYGIWLAASVLGLASVALSRRVKPAALPVLSCLAASAVFIVWLRPYVIGGHAAGPYYAVHLLALAGAAGCVLCWQLSGARPGLSLAAGCALGAFCACDWLWSIHLLAPVYSEYGFHTEEAAVRSALKRGGLLSTGAPPPRVSFDPNDLCEDEGMRSGFSTYSSYANPSLRRVWRYLHVACGVPESKTDFIRLPAAIGENADRLNSISLAARLEPGSGTLRLLGPRDPRAYIVFGADTVDNWAVAVDRMAAGYGFHERALVEAGLGPGFQAPAGAPSGNAEIREFRNERVSLETRASAPGILVLGEAWYPGWHAAIDGRDAPVFPVNGWMRGVVVPAGGGRVVFAYFPRGLWAGLAISLLSTAAAATMYLSGRGKSAKGGPHA
jgi:hypothetical protein